MMKMTRLIRSTLGDDSSGYRLAWQLVVGIVANNNVSRGLIA